MENAEENTSENYLTESQKRSLTISLFLFEKALRKSAQLLSEENETGIFYSRKSSLSSEKRLIIQKKISQTLNELALFAKKMEFSTTEENIESEIMADMSISWENLEECRSKRLRGYGNLDPRAVKLIDPAINHFSHTALELYGLVEVHSQDVAIEEAWLTKKISPIFHPL